MDEAEALIILARNADPVAVGIIAADVCSPWQSERRGVRGKPDRLAASEYQFLSLIDALSGDLRPQTTEGRGLQAWLEFHRLALSWAGIEGPQWTQDQSLRPHYLALPPKGWPQPITDELLTLDGRVAALHVLAAGDVIPTYNVDQSPRDPGSANDTRAGNAVRCLASWIIESSWSTVSADQCRALKPDWRTAGGRQWWNRSQTAADVDQLVALVAGPLSVPADWTRPEPTAEEQQARVEHDRVLLRGRMHAAAWGRAIDVDGSRV